MGTPQAVYQIDHRGPAKSLRSIVNINFDLWTVRVDNPYTSYSGSCCEHIARPQRKRTAIQQPSRFGKA